MVRRKRRTSGDSPNAGDKQDQNNETPEHSPVEASAVADSAEGNDGAVHRTRKRKPRRRSRRTSRGSANADKESSNKADAVAKDSTKESASERDAMDNASQREPRNSEKKKASKKTGKKTRGTTRKTTPKAAKKTSKKVASTTKKTVAKTTTKKVAKKTTKKAAKKTTESSALTATAQSNKKKASSRSRQGSGRFASRRLSAALPEADSGPSPTDRLMVVNEVPGQECRIAFLDERKLDEYYVERSSSATVVGNIYKARVTNVEPAIQAAFVDFGLGESGFLHVSDLHPRYFPGGKVVEQVGKKIPRRQRPPMQDALQKGQEILVQVLKQGIGSKGPTVTSYLSIPGRLMVMMPDMDRVGVSRKVADDAQRREMREILDSLDLPEKFGFIVRTAGFSVSKTELKRDVAYLKRLWQQMERRMQNTGAPCLLYAESDLLIRTIRDVVDASISTIIVDDPAAFERVSAFLKVAAPRSAPEVRFYDRSTPIFTAFEIERQVEDLHSSTVPLKSGGALVIEQTEALVAIDVNSGRSRSARDSETNAFETNKEAVDEICRQLRLRDLGGVIINDLIDMRVPRNREEIEARFMSNLKRDRAKSTVLPISEFGIVEMTRQRMRPNTWRANFQECPTCSGTGELPRVDSVAAAALRRVAVLLDHELTQRVEMVSSTNVAEVLTNTRHLEIARLEERSEKRVVVRVSDTINDERVDLYAYDSNGADLDTTQIQRRKPLKVEDLPLDVPEEIGNGTSAGPRKRRRRRRGKTAPADATAIALAGGFEIDEDESEPSDKAEKASAEVEETTTKKKRRRRRGGRGRRRADAPDSTPDPTPDPATDSPSDSIRIYKLARELNTSSRTIIDRCTTEGGFDLKNHMSTVAGEALSRIRTWFIRSLTEEETPAEPQKRDEPQTESQPADSVDKTDEKPKRRSRRRRGRRGRGKKPVQEESALTPDREEPQEPAKPSTEAPATSEPVAEEEQPPRKRKRRRRGGRRRNRKKNGQPQAEDSKNDSDTPPTAEKEESHTTPPPKPKPKPKPAPARAPAPTPRTEPEVKPAATNTRTKKPRTLYGGRMRRTGRT